LTLIEIGLSGQAGDDLLAIESFQGAYNQKQFSGRIYVDAGADGDFWLSRALPSGITVTNLSYNASDPDGALKALLAAYGPQGTNTVTQYIVCDPLNQPETCNMATTMAGIYDTMIVRPENLSLVQSYGLTQYADLRTYLWIGSNQTLVASTIYNRVSNPSGSSGTSGWSANAGTVSTGTGSGSCAGQGTTLKWTRSGSGGAFAYTDPSSMRLNSTPYVFSMQVCVQSGAAVYLDAWDGTQDLESSSASTGQGWVTLQIAAPIPLTTAGSSNTTILLQVRTNGGSTTAFFHNAAVIDNRVAIDEYQLTTLMGSTTQNILAQDFPTSPNLRDYLIAGKIFTYELTSDNSDEVSLYSNILSNSHTAHVTPIMGYIDDENHDVTFLSEAAQNGHFLNASDNYNNGSVWASMPELLRLSQPAPSSIKPTNGTVYVAFAPSDGDNLSIDQHTTPDRWTSGKYLGAVPLGWTTSPGMINIAPGLLSYYYDFLPQTSEMIAGPSGVGYSWAITGSDLTTFASDTDQFMQAESMSTVNSSETSSSDNDTYASDLSSSSYAVPHIVAGSYLAPSSHGSTELDGQGTGYNKTPAEEISAIESWVSSNYAGSGAPTYLEALHDNLTTSADDVLLIAQQLQLNGGHPYIFLTPSELGMTEHAAGTAPINVEAVAGSTLTKAYPQNLLNNADGQEPQLSMTSSNWAIGTSGHNENLASAIYQGASCEKLYVPGNSSNPTIYAWEGLKNVPLVNSYYKFSVTVAGSGTAQMTVYDGSANQHSASVTLTSSWQTITMVVYMKSTTTGQIQVGIVPSSSGQTLYFNGTAKANPAWSYNEPGSSTNFSNLDGATYNNGYFNDQAFAYNVPAGMSNIQYVSQYGVSYASGSTYNASVDVAGTPGGQAYVAVWNGSTEIDSSTVTLAQQWQTLKVTATADSTLQWELKVPASLASSQTVYFRNASIVPASSLGTTDFSTGLESGDTQLTWISTVDNTSPGGGESNVSSALAESSSTITRAGGYAIQYGGTASGGSSTHSYLEAFSISATITSTSRLSYWVYPMTPMGSESGASSMAGLNSTCVALDIIFTDGTALRNFTTVTDQYGNLLNPAHQCNHLQPDQWNYVTADLSSISGKTISRIDVGYDQPGANGNHGGYIDNMRLSH
jgi:hypothetical protein